MHKFPPYYARSLAKFFAIKCCTKFTACIVVVHHMMCHPSSSFSRHCLCWCVVTRGLVKITVTAITKTSNDEYDNVNKCNKSSNNTHFHSIHLRANPSEGSSSVKTNKSLEGIGKTFKVFKVVINNFTTSIDWVVDLLRWHTDDNGKCKWYPEQPGIQLYSSILTVDWNIAQLRDAIRLETWTKQICPCVRCRCRRLLDLTGNKSNILIGFIAHIIHIKWDHIVSTCVISFDNKSKS